MPLTSKKQAFDEFKAGALHSGKGGPVVTNRKQAIAIALSTERRTRGRMGGSRKLSSTRSAKSRRNSR